MPISLKDVLRMAGNPNSEETQNTVEGVLQRAREEEIARAARAAAMGTGDGGTNPFPWQESDSPDDRRSMSYLLNLAQQGRDVNPERMQSFLDSSGVDVNRLNEFIAQRGWRSPWGGGEQQ